MFNDKVEHSLISSSFISIIQKVCQLAIFTYFQFHKVQVLTTSPTIAWSSALCGCISGISSMCTIATSTLNQNFGIVASWNFSNPHWSLTLLDATFCLTFFGFSNTTNCPIANYIHLTSKCINISCNFNAPNHICICIINFQNYSLCNPLSSQGIKN